MAELPADMALVAEKNFAIVSDTITGTPLVVELHVVEADAVALRIDMRLAHRIGLVTGIAEGLSERRQVGHFEPRLKAPVAMDPRRRAGHQGAPRRNADRMFGIGVGEAHPVAAHLVEHRRVDGFLASRT